MSQSVGIHLVTEGEMQAWPEESAVFLSFGWWVTLFCNKILKKPLFLFLWKNVIISMVSETVFILSLVKFYLCWFKMLSWQVTSGIRESNEGDINVYVLPLWVTHLWLYPALDNGSLEWGVFSSDTWRDLWAPKPSFGCPSFVPRGGWHPSQPPPHHHLQN